MQFVCLKEYIKLFSKKQSLIQIHKKLVGFADNSWNETNLRNNVLNSLDSKESLNKIIEKYIPSSEDYYNFESDFFCYLVGIPIRNQEKLKTTLELWGLSYNDIIPNEIRNYIIEKNKSKIILSTNEISFFEYTDYSILIQVLYIMSIIYKRTFSDYNAIYNHVKSFITKPEFNNYLSLLASKFRILSANTLNYTTSEPIIKWLKNYPLSKFADELYSDILSNNTNYKDLLKFFVSINIINGNWISESMLNKLVSSSDLNKLCGYQLIYKAQFNDKNIYKLTNMGYYLTTKNKPNKWICNTNCILDDDIIYIPHIDDPEKILDLLFNYTLTNPGEFLMIFKV